MLVVLIYIKQTAFFVTLVFLLVLDVLLDHRFIQSHFTWDRLRQSFILDHPVPLGAFQQEDLLYSGNGGA